jgi:hypothetical protein
VTACDYADTNCNQVIASGTTNSTGEVPLPLGQVQALQGPRNNGLRGFLHVTATTYVPFYYDWGYPLSQPDVFLYGEVVTPSDLQTFATTCTSRSIRTAGTCPSPRTTVSEMAAPA